MLQTKAPLAGFKPSLVKPKFTNLIVFKRLDKRRVGHQQRDTSRLVALILKLYSRPRGPHLLQYLLHVHLLLRLVHNVADLRRKVREKSFENFTRKFREFKMDLTLDFIIPISQVLINKGPDHQKS